MKAQKSYIAKTGEVEREWVVVDAADQVLGRLATRITKMLRGKNHPTFTPHVDTGNFVVVINAGKVRLTGAKMDGDMRYHHSGYPGGIKERSPREILAKNPDELLRIAVWGMMPKNTLSRHQMKKLKIYGGNEHPHVAQQAQAL